MALTSGDTFFPDDCVECTTPAVNLLDSIEASGRTWTAYMEDMPAPCTTSDSGVYVARHNPFVHYDDIVGDGARCSNGVVPSSGFGSDLAANTLASFVWITPNLCNDMHDCSIATGDAWLQAVVPQILQSPAFANSVLFVVWDEGTTTAGGGGHIPLIVASPMTPAGTQSTQAATHYSLLRTIEDAWGLSPLGQSANATALSDFFSPAPTPPGTPDSPSPDDGATGVDTGSTLTWAAAGGTSYDVSFDTVNPPSTVSAGQGVAAYTPAGLAANTTYYWQIVAYNDAGATTGPVWSFTTAEVEAHRPPTS
jgi:acid phosphatase